MGKCLNSTELHDTLILAECSDGFWLYDKTRGMNLSMRAKTPQDAFIECILYYQKRLLTMEKIYGDLKTQVDNFVSQFSDEGD